MMPARAARRPAANASCFYVAIPRFILQMAWRQAGEYLLPPEIPSVYSVSARRVNIGMADRRLMHAFEFLL